MKSRILIIAILMGISSSFLQARGQDMLTSSYNLDFIKEHLIEKQKWVPYPAYTDRAAWDNLLGENKAKVIARGDRKLSYQWQLITATDYLEYERSGNRKVMEDAHTNNQNTLSDLLLAELAEGSGRFIDQIINGVFLQCERTSWVLSAHLPAQLSKRTLPEEDDTVIDLGSARLAGLLAWTYYFLHEEFDKVNPEISKRLHNELYRKMILPYRNETRYWWMALDKKNYRIVNNWNPWCNFNALQCLLLLENDKELLAQDIYKSLQSVDQFINYTTKDGACEEGPSYWGHAAGKLFDYLKVLSLGTGGNISLFNTKLIKDMGEYMPNTYVADDWVVNFADASAKFSSDVGLIFRYGEAVNSDLMQSFAAHLFQEGKGGLTFGVDMFRALESIQYYNDLKSWNKPFVKEEVVAYPITQFYYLKSSDFFLAVKGGHNDESHNHNDVGTFTLFYKNRPYIIDVGVGTYTRQTFGPERYSIWTMQSAYHNLPIINGTEQLYGKEYRAKSVDFNPRKKKIAIDISTAYPKESATEKWVRGYALTKNKLVIEDSFKLKEVNEQNEIHFMLHGEVEVEAGRVMISNSGESIQISFDANLFTPEVEEVSLTDIRLTKVWGDTLYRLKLVPKERVTADKYSYVITPVK